MCFLFFNFALLIINIANNKILMKINFSCNSFCYSRSMFFLW